jgi:hypothetical protein
LEQRTIQNDAKHYTAIDNHLEDCCCSCLGNETTAKFAFKSNQGQVVNGINGGGGDDNINEVQIIVVNQFKSMSFK